MILGALLYPMLAHVVWVVLLYTLLTLFRAPTVWSIGKRPDGSNPWGHIEPKVSANLANQFQWPLFFYVACVLAIIQEHGSDPVCLWLAWIFVVGRIVHSGVQIFANSIRLRGIVFTINFLAVLGMWAHLAISSSVAAQTSGLPNGIRSLSSIWVS